MKYNTDNLLDTKYKFIMLYIDINGEHPIMENYANTLEMPMVLLDLEKNFNDYVKSIIPLSFRKFIAVREFDYIGFFENTAENLKIISDLMEDFDESIVFSYKIGVFDESDDVKLSVFDNNYTNIHQIFDSKLVSVIREARKLSKSKFKLSCDNHMWVSYAVPTSNYGGSNDIEQAGYCIKCHEDTHNQYFL